MTISPVDTQILKILTTTQTLSELATALPFLSRRALKDRLTLLINIGLVVFSDGKFSRGVQ